MGQRIERGINKVHVKYNRNWEDTEKLPCTVYKWHKMVGINWSQQLQGRHMVIPPEAYTVRTNWKKTKTMIKLEEMRTRRDEKEVEMNRKSLPTPFK